MVILINDQYKIGSSRRGSVMKSPVTGFHRAGRGVKFPCGLQLPRTVKVTFEETNQSLKEKRCCPSDNELNPLALEKDLDVVSLLVSNPNIDEDCFKNPIV